VAAQGRVVSRSDFDGLVSSFLRTTD
jgi:hypothetical protein